jgi:hypothetical protein
VSLEKLGRRSFCPGRSSSSHRSGSWPDRRAPIRPPFNDGQPGLFRAGDSRDPPAHLYDKGITAGSDHAVVVADLTVT